MADARMVGHETGACWCPLCRVPSHRRSLKRKRMIEKRAAKRGERQRWKLDVLTGRDA